MKNSTFKAILTVSFTFALIVSVAFFTSLHAQNVQGVTVNATDSTLTLTGNTFQASEVTVTGYTLANVPELPAIKVISRTVSLSKGQSYIIDANVNKKLDFVIVQSSQGRERIKIEFQDRAELAIIRAKE